MLITWVPLAVALIIILTIHEIWRRSRSRFGIPKAGFSWPKLIQYLFLSYGVNEPVASIVFRNKSKYGDIFELPVFGRDHFVLCGEEGINWAAKQEREDKLIRMFSGNAKHIFLSQSTNKDNTDKDVWKNTRAKLSPALMQSSTINNFCPTMARVINKHLSTINIIDVNTLAPIIFEVGWLFIVGKRGFEYSQQVYQYYKEVKQGLFASPLNFPWTKLGKGLLAREKIEEVVLKILDDDPTAKDDSDCSLPAIVDSSGGKSQIGVRIFGLLFAATDTTSMTFSGLLWHLIDNPTILKKLEEEIRAQTEPHTLGDFQKFPYLNKVVNEALRLYGVDLVFRESKIELQYNKIQFPAGTLFVVATGYEHGGVSNPDQFDPDREGKYKLEPFGTPSRNCLGKIFAQFQMKMLLYYILKQFDVVGEKDEGACVIKQGGYVSLKNARLRRYNHKGSFFS